MDTIEQRADEMCAEAYLLFGDGCRAYFHAITETVADGAAQAAALNALGDAVAGAGGLFAIRFAVEGDELLAAPHPDSTARRAGFMLARLDHPAAIDPASLAYMWSWAATGRAADYERQGVWTWREMARLGALCDQIDAAVAARSANRASPNT